MDCIETDAHGSSAGYWPPDRLDALARSLLSDERYDHSLRSADTAVDLCARYGLDVERGRVLGITHDVCKEFPRAEQERLAAGHWETLPPYMLTEGRFLHGPAAAVYLAKLGAVRDAELLDAITWHTTGRPGMGDLGLALYAADKLEPGRSSWRDGLRARLDAGEFDGPSGLRSLAAAVAALTMDYVASQGWPIAPGTLVLYNALTGEDLGSWPAR